MSALLNLTSKEWEDLCDGCGRCCVIKLQDEDTDEILYTNVACEFLDSDNCRCTRYSNRAKVKPDCVVLSKHNLDVLEQMPYTCAYRLVHENRTLSVADLSVSAKVVSEKYIDDEQLPEHIVEWISCYPEVV